MGQHSCELLCYDKIDNKIQNVARNIKNFVHLLQTMQCTAGDSEVFTLGIMYHDGASLPCRKKCSSLRALWITHMQVAALLQNWLENSKCSASHQKFCTHFTSHATCSKTLDIVQFLPLEWYSVTVHHFVCCHPFTAMKLTSAMLRRTIA